MGLHRQIYDALTFYGSFLRSQISDVAHTSKHVFLGSLSIQVARIQPVDLSPNSLVFLFKKFSLLHNSFMYIQRLRVLLAQLSPELGMMGRVRFT